MRTAVVLRIVLEGLIVAGIAMALGIAPGANPPAAILPGLLQQIESSGFWGPLLLAGVYAIACVLFVPGTILTLAAGFLFGVAWGTIAVSFGSVAGACAAFLVGRTLLRDGIERRIARYPKFEAFDRGIGEQGFKIVLLLRLSPAIPFNLLNYALGVTKVRFRQYLVASWIGMFPATVMYVYFGTALKGLTEVAAGRVQGGSLETVFFVVGLIMTVVATVVVTRVARDALAGAISGEETEEAAALNGSGPIEIETPIEGEMRG